MKTPRCDGMEHLSSDSQCPRLRTNLKHKKPFFFQVSRVRLWRTPVINLILTFFWETNEASQQSSQHLLDFASLGQTLNENGIHQRWKIDQYVVHTGIY